MRGIKKKFWLPEKTQAAFITLSSDWDQHLKKKKENVSEKTTVTLSQPQLFKASK